MIQFIKVVRSTRSVRKALDGSFFLFGTIEYIGYWAAPVILVVVLTIEIVRHQHKTELIRRNRARIVHEAGVDEGSYAL